LTKPVILMRKLHNQRGQAIVEAGIVMLLLILLAGGVMQFAHAFMIANMITHAARDGARLAASWQSRGACGQLTNTADIQTTVANEIAAVTAETFTVTVSQTPAVGSSSPPCDSAGTTPAVTVNVQGCVPFIFNMLRFGNCTSGGALGFQVNRNAIFPDELRGTFG
jgi:Flp pilus assembly protein TadG